MRAQEQKMSEKFNMDEQVAERAAGRVSRRQFLEGAAIAGASAVIEPTVATSAEAQATYPRSSGNAAEANLPNPIVPNFSGQYGNGSLPQFECPKRPMGSTGLQVSILGVGGYHLGTVPTQDEVNNLIAKALDYGINFFDNAWEYHKGASEEKLGIALKGRRDKAIVM